MNATQVYNIARREYLARVRNKAFIFTTLLVPALIALNMSLGRLLDRADLDELRISVVDVQTGQSDEVQAKLAQIDEFAVVVTETLDTDTARVEATREGLRSAVLGEQIDGYLVLETDDEVGLRGRYFARETGNLAVMRALERAVRDASLEDYLADSGLDPGRISAMIGWDLEATTISEEGEEEGGFESAFLSTFALTFLLYITVIMGGQQMGMSIVEEKTSRLIELVLGAVTSTEFMAGKIIGVLGAGLTQLAIWVGFALLASLYILPALAIGASMQGMGLLEMINPSLLAYFAIFYILGYLFYAVVFAAVASICTSTEEFSQLAFPAMLPIMIGFFFTFYVITNPSATLSRVMSLLPPFTPLVMLARINVLRPPFWEILLSIVLLIAGAAALVWLAAKIFRFALLMHGKRPDIGTVVRLLRAA